MRKYDVFGKKITQIRPFYLLIALFIIIIPAHFLLTYQQSEKMDDLLAEKITLQTQIAELLLAHQNEVVETITLGKLYSGFEDYYFDFYLEEEIDLYLDLADLTLVESKQINITDDPEISPIDNLSNQIAYKQIDLEFIADDGDKVFSFLEILLESDKLFYTETVESNLLIDNSLQIRITMYVFYLTEIEQTP